MMNAGDSLCLQTPGGGGFGDPLERSPVEVLEDVRLEYYSLDTAQHVYGVIIDGDSLTLDETATRAKRLAMKSQKSSP